MNVSRGTAWLIGLVVVAIAGAVAYAGTATPAPDAPKVHKNVVIFRSGGSWLGVQIADVDADRAHVLGLHEEMGAEVQSVSPGSPAEEAGIQKGDVITEYQGSRIEGVSQLTRLVRETPAGRAATVKIVRDGSAQTLKVKVGERSESEGPQVHRFAFKGDGDGDGDESDFEMPEIPEIPEFDFKTLGNLGNLDIPGILEAHGIGGRPRLGAVPQLSEFFGVKQGSGVLVKSVKKGSPGDKAGLRAGDVIVKVEDENVEDVSDLHLALKERRDKDVRITVVRDRRETALTVPPLPETPATPAAPEAPQPPAPHGHRPGAQSAFNQQIQQDVERALRDARAAQADAWRALRDKQRVHADALKGAGASIEVDVDTDDTSVAPEASDEDGDDAIDDAVATPAPEAVEVQPPSPQDDAAIRRAVQEARRIRIETQQGPAQ
jgi:serine protease Do